MSEKTERDLADAVRVYVDHMVKMQNLTGDSGGTIEEREMIAALWASEAALDLREDRSKT